MYDAILGRSPSESSYSLVCEAAYGSPQIKGLLRASPADFQVYEDLGFTPSGEGEHVFLQLRKTGINTAELSKRIAQLAAVNLMDIGYAGLKDRHAVATQWFSVYRPKGGEVDWFQLEKLHNKSTELKVEKVEVLTVSCHNKKLRRGQHAANKFQLCIRDCTGIFDGLEERLWKMKEQGVPNYFGPQRFGFCGGNLAAAQRLLVDKQLVRNRQLRGLYLSAARSYLFNQVLRARIEDDSWLTVEEGDVALVDNKHTSEIWPTGPLWGRGRLASTQRIGELEIAVIKKSADWCHGLEHAGLKQERRSLCLAVKDLSWSVNRSSKVHNIEMIFSLPVGGYATSVIREIIDYHEPDFSERRCSK